jgi:hypothetical protein
MATASAALAGFAAGFSIPAAAIGLTGVCGPAVYSGLFGHPTNWLKHSDGKTLVRT